MINPDLWNDFVYPEEDMLCSVDTFDNLVSCSSLSDKDKIELMLKFKELSLKQNISEDICESIDGCFSEFTEWRDGGRGYIRIIKKEW